MKFVSLTFILIVNLASIVSRDFFGILFVIVENLSISDYELLYKSRLFEESTRF